MESTLRGGVPDTVKLIETFGWRPGEGVRFDEAHLDRMEASAAKLGYPFDREVAQIHFPKSGSRALRCRLTLDSQGVFDYSQSPLGNTAGRWRVAIYPERLSAADPWLRVKTTHRALYDQASAAMPDGVDEWLFQNETGVFCEGTITNLFVEMTDGQKVTPPVSDGLLPGILRGELLKSGWVEAQVKVADLSMAREIYMGNALRGLIPVEIAQVF